MDAKEKVRDSDGAFDSWWFREVANAEVDIDQFDIHQLALIIWIAKQAWRASAALAAAEKAST